jgi:ABC-type lipoprotein release transport system permease subunit
MLSRNSILTTIINSPAKQRNAPMWLLKGIILGLLFFAAGTFLFLIAFLRRLGPLLAPAGQHWSIEIGVISRLTINNAWFWIALAACLALGFAIVASWPSSVPRIV